MHLTFVLFFLILWKEIESMKLLFSILLIIPVILTAQSTITLQPHFEDGNNTYLRTGWPDLPAVGVTDLTNYTWTCSGDLCLARGLFTFNLEEITLGSTVNSALLYLYADLTTTNCYGGDEPHAGTNASHIYRVLENWDYNTVTWNTQPGFSLLHAVPIEESTDPQQDYILDVTTLVQDWVDNPLSSFGFLIKLDNEIDYYSSLIFCSSFNTDTTKHPKLIVEYTKQLDISNTTSPEIAIYPNPAKETIIIQLNYNANKFSIFNLYDHSGRIIRSFKFQEGSDKFEISITDIPSGLYFISDNNGNYKTIEIVN